MIQVKAGFTQPPTFPVEPNALLPSINRQFVADAKRGISEKASGKGGSRYMTMRSGKTRDSVFGHVTPTGGEVGASGPGVGIQEEGTEGLPGGVIRPKRGEFLTFQLHADGDTTERTGRWVRLRSVRIRASHFIRDSVEESMVRVPEFLSHALREAGW